MNKLRVDDLYYSLAMLVPVFVSMKHYKKSKEYADIEFEPDKDFRTPYYLNSNGKELMRKCNEEGFLL